MMIKHNKECLCGKKELAAIIHHFCGETKLNNLRLGVNKHDHNFLGHNQILVQATVLPDLTIFKKN